MIETMYELPKRRHSWFDFNTNNINITNISKRGSNSAKICRTLEDFGSKIDSIKDEAKEQKNYENKELNANTKVINQLKSLANAFAQRGEVVKKQISQPLKRLKRDAEESVTSELNSSIIEEEWMQNMDITRVNQLKKSAFKELCYKLRKRELGVFEPQSSIYISWLFIVSIAFVYNAVIIFLRCVFPYENHNNRYIFFTFDYTCDAIYVIDMIWFKMRLKYVFEGQWVEDPKLTRKNYLKRKGFIFDTLSLLPLDLLYLKYGFDKPLLRLLRLTRLFKIQTFWEFFNRVDTITKSPYVIRIIHTLIYKMYLIHLSTCAYYLMSWFEGFGSTKWTYDNKGNAYLRCSYFAFRTATSIGGRMPKPTNELERVYMIVSWLMGVFVFALLIGQIRDIVATATQNKAHYRNILNQTVRYMRNLNLPHYLQKRVRLWLTFTWDQQKTFDENQILELLPRKMRTDIALSVNYQTLSKVQLFKGCDRTVLRDLVLKLRPALFLPGDYVCRKGDVGREMYIVNKGHVCVMGDNKTILATLSKGSVFGEIAILGTDSFIRRTVDILSVGYSNLFVLSKADLWDTLKNYPEYQSVFKQKVRNLMKFVEKEDQNDLISNDIEVESIIHTSERTPTPRLIHTVMQMVPPDSQVSQMLSRSTSITRSSISLTSSLNNSLKIKSQSSNTLEDNSTEPLNDETINNNNNTIDDQLVNDIINDV